MTSPNLPSVNLGDDICGWTLNPSATQLLLTQCTSTCPIHGTEIHQEPGLSLEIREENRIRWS